MKDVASIIKKEFKKLRGWSSAIFVGAFVLQLLIFFFVFDSVQNAPAQSWLLEALIASIILVMTAIFMLFLIERYQEHVRKNASKIIDPELHRLKAANNRFQSLQDMASTLRATLNFEQVVEKALDVCSLTLEEMGVPGQSLVGAVFLFKGDELTPVATRRFLSNDFDKTIQGKSGIVGTALTQAEPTTTNNPRRDPELRQIVAFQNCLTVVCIPLRAGFQIFGAMVIGTDTAVKFDEDHLNLFNSVADHAVIALQNAQLYQTLEKEKQRIIEADEEARKELARDLHDGPTQTIAAIAMRLNFIRSLVAKDPQQALVELSKVEDLAKQTSKEVRGMLFTLRPLVLETQGLGRAIETVMKRIRETDSLNMRLVGGEYGDLLDEQAQSVVFSIVEEALGNARKYSEADLIEVRMWQEDNLFVVRVQDDGIGFDTEDVNRDYSSRGSLGMVNMRERAERIDGSLRVESAPGQGTSVTLVVPLEKHGRQVAVQ